jgi:hypothetical protein
MVKEIPDKGKRNRQNPEAPAKVVERLIPKEVKDLNLFKMQAFSLRPE